MDQQPESKNTFFQTEDLLWPDSESQELQKEWNKPNWSILTRKKITEYKLTDKFNASGLGKRIQKQNRRLELTDFERFKVQVLKKKLGKAVRTHVNKNRKALVAKAK